MTVYKSNGRLLSIVSGAIAGFASLFGKAPSINIEDHYFNQILQFIPIESNVSWQFLCYGMYIVTNVFMWIAFVKALKYSKSTSEAVILNTISNYIISGIIGQVVFQEHIKPQWCVGLVLICTGILLIVCDNSNNQSNDTANQKKEH